MKMKIRNILAGVLFALPFWCSAQLEPVFTQYFFNELVINPAYAGAHVQFSATSSFRNQWINFPGSPQTFSFSAHSSFYKGKVGLGMLVNLDRIGSYSNKYIAIPYAYKIKFAKSTLSFGLQSTMYIIAADFSGVNFKYDDPSFVPINKMRPNFGAGVFYSKRDFFVGVSVPYLLNTSFQENGELGGVIQQKRNYFIRSGFIQKLDPKGTVKINPNILIRNQEGQPLSVDLNAGFIFNDVLNVGASYRSGNTLISFISMKLSEKLYFNYSFDLARPELASFASGTHEFMINFRHKITQAHSNLQCPGYHNYRE
jgi:type IX secretion system PorP/SprF family membrane protein